MLKNLFLLSAFTAFCVAIWIGLEIQHNATNTTISKPTQSHILPILSSFDTKTLGELKKRDIVRAILSEPIGIFSENASKSAVANKLNTIFSTSQVASDGASL